MAGLVPVRNGVFSSTADFNNQSLTGATGISNKVFSSFTTLPASNTTLSLTASAAYSIILNTGGNKIISSITGPEGSEIIFVVTGGYITFSGSFSDYRVLRYPGTYRINLPGPVISGEKKGYALQLYVTDCCSSPSPTAYYQACTAGTNIFNINYPVFTDNPIFSALANTSSEYPLVIGGTGYYFSGGFATQQDCISLAYDNLYDFYSSDGALITAYTTSNTVNLFTDDVKNYRWKGSVEVTYNCDNAGDLPNGCYYRLWDMIYGGSYPATVVNGYIVDTTTLC